MISVTLILGFVFLGSKGFGVIEFFWVGDFTLPIWVAGFLVVFFWT